MMIETEKISALICRLGIELYRQIIHQVDDPEELESFSIDAESKDGYIYKITISRTMTEGEHDD